MPSQAFTDVIQRVDRLDSEEQYVLLEYLTDTLMPAMDAGRPIIQLGGVLGDLDVPADSDPIAETLDELRRERAAHFDEEWPA
jgi:hypothetical protein